jgi:hypothetical protein
MHKCARLPAPGGNRFDKSVATECPAPKTSQVRLQAGFVKKYESFSIYACLALKPVGTFESNIFSILLGRSL